MLTLVKELPASELPTHSVLAQRMLDRIGVKMKELFPDNKRLIEQFEAGCYTRCVFILNDLVTNFKLQRQYSPRTRKDREQLFHDLNKWNNNYAQYLNPPSPSKAG